MLLMDRHIPPASPGREAADRTPWQEAIAVIGYAIAYIGYLFVHPEGEVAHWLSLVALPVLGLALLRGKRATVDVRQLLLSVGIGRKPLARGIVAAVVVGGAISAVQLFGRNGPAIRELFTSGRAAWALPTSIVLMTLTAATTEEFFFRGVLQTRLAALMPARGDWAAVVVTALLFAAYHVPYAYGTAGWGTQGDLVAAGTAALATGLPLGLLLGAVFSLGRQSLVVSILAHALINALPGMLIVERWLGR
jgi:membrane protease YdiL (CAAX protease family)